MIGPSCSSMICVTFNYSYEYYHKSLWSLYFHTLSSVKSLNSFFSHYLTYSFIHSNEFYSFPSFLPIHSEAESVPHRCSLAKTIFFGFEFAANIPQFVLLFSISFERKRFSSDFRTEIHKFRATTASETPTLALINQANCQWAMVSIVCYLTNNFAL